MIELSADDALARPERGNRIAICFARAQDVDRLARYLGRFTDLLGVEFVRVEPDPEHRAARVLQVARHPTFWLYVDGNERFCAVGVPELIDCLERYARGV